jgi:hypothetical protein
MIKFLRRNQQAFIFFIVFYSFFSVFSVYIGRENQQNLPIPFLLPFLANYKNLLFELDNSGIILSVFTGIGLLFAGFYLTRTTIKFLILQNRVHFPAIFLISVSSFAFYQELFSEILISVIFVLFIINRIFGIVSGKKLSLKYLDVGILLAIGSLFYFNIIFLLPFLWISQYVLRQFNWRELLYTLIGLALPFLYILTGYFILDKSIKEMVNMLLQWMALDKVVNYTWPLLASLGFYLFVMIIANLFVLRRYATAKVQQRKYYQLLFFLFLNVVLIFVIIPSVGIEIFILLSVPVSILLSSYFSDCRNSFFNNILLMLLLLIPVALNIFG